MNPKREDPMHALSAPAARIASREIRRPVLDGSDAQLYSVDFAPLQEGHEARLLLQPGRGAGATPGAELVWRGNRLEYRLRVVSYLPERSAGRRGKPATRSNRLSVKVLSIGPRTPDAPAPCSVCRGSGAVEVPGTCPECHGHAHGCADCDGTGRIDWSECSACRGHGHGGR